MLNEFEDYSNCAYRIDPQVNFDDLGRRRIRLETELLKIAIDKQNAVKQQKFTEAAEFRQKERKLENERDFVVEYMNTLRSRYGVK